MAVALMAVLAPACGGTSTNSADIDDSIAFYGDSITDRAFKRDILPGYSEVANSEDARRNPSYVDLGTSGWRSVDALANLDAILTANPGFKYWALCFGTNDLYFVTGPDTFKANMQAMVDKLRAAGKIPVIPTIPYGIGWDPVDYNTALKGVHGAMGGPDLYGWFKRHQEELLDNGVQAPPGSNGDGVHPSDAGRIMVNVLWAKAMEKIYH